MSFEAMNHIGEEGLDVLIILNDNKSSIDENRGALAQRDSYAEYCRALGINYLGECDGHNISELLEKLPTALESDGPRMLRVNTHKGKGFTRSEIKKKAGRTFQQVFGDTMLALAEEDKRLVVISPAMLSGGGLRGFAERYPDRCIDVGIAEQHAVTLAAGLAADGMKPVVHLYSTFAQRAYDQIIHDVALQNLDVTFVIDRAGLVGADGSYTSRCFRSRLLQHHTQPANPFSGKCGHPGDEPEKNESRIRTADLKNSQRRSDPKAGAIASKRSR
jgi:1-deoxy-D-xylulose-5-phosphate synthase